MYFRHAIDMDLQTFRLNSVPSTVFYIPNFISEQEENHILKEVYGVPKPKWTQLSRRRLQNWGGIPHSKGMIPEVLPQWLQKYTNKVIELGIFHENSLPNHVLINEYLPGQGIHAHLDGPLFYPTVATISCGSPTVLHFYCNQVNNNNMEIHESNAKKLYSLLLESRSLLVLQDDMYTKFMHGIEEKEDDIIDVSINNLSMCKNNEVGDIIKRKRRISLTIRNVPKCSSFKLTFGKN